MGHLHHFSAGWISPVLAYAMACVGSALGLRCTVRARAAEGRSRRNWLLTASVAIGSGIWTMHFIAMLGFGVTGSPVHYDVPLTVLSLLIAMVVVGAGLFTVGYGAPGLRSLLLGGLGTGVGVAAMHYLGMAAMRLHGHVDFDPGLVALSVVIAAGCRHRRPVGRAQRAGHRRCGRGLPRHGARRQQHALHRNGCRAHRIDAQPSAVGGCHRNGIHLSAGRRTRFISLPHSGLCRSVPDRPRTCRSRLRRFAARALNSPSRPTC